MNGSVYSFSNQFEVYRFIYLTSIQNLRENQVLRTYQQALSNSRLHILPRSCPSHLQVSSWTCLLLTKRKYERERACCMCHFFSIPMLTLVFIAESRSYKQYKFNILHEQSEGFSKLITEVTSALLPPHSPATGLPPDPSTISPQNAYSLSGNTFSVSLGTLTSTQTGPLMLSFTKHPRHYLSYSTHRSWTSSLLRM